MKFKGSKPIAPSWLGYFVSGVAVFMIACLGVGVYFFNKNQITYGGICIGLAVLQFAFMVFCNYYFGWVAGGEFKVFDKTVIYTYTEVVDLLGHNKFKYTIKGVSSIKRKGKNLIVKGDIVYKRPLGKAKDVKKCIVYDVDDKAQKYLEDRIAELSLLQNS